MGLTIAVWKWVDGRERANTLEVFTDLCSDQAHDSVGRFDIAQFERSLRQSVHHKDEFPFELSPADFKSHSSNCLFLHTGYETGARFLRNVVQVATSLGLVVFSGELGRLVSYTDAEAMFANWAESLRKVEFKKQLYDSIIAKYVTPAALRAGLKSSGRGYRKAEGDRVCTVFPFFRDFGDTSIAITLGVGFVCLLRFQNQYRAFCREKPWSRKWISHHSMNLPAMSPGIRPESWDIGDEASTSTLGTRIASVLEREASSFFAEIQSIQDLISRWESMQRRNACNIATAYWVLEQRTRAIGILDARDVALDELLAKRHHPPSRSEKIEIRFLRDFLKSQICSGESRM